MNIPPIVTASDKIALLGTKLNGVDLASATDPDGDPILRWRFRDLGGAANSAQILVNGNPRASGTWVTVSTPALGNLEIEAGSAVGKEDFWVQAWDGKQWSESVLFSVYSVVANTRAPVMTASTIQVVANEKVLAKDFFSWSDPDGWPADRWKFRDERVGKNSGYFELNGVKMTENVWFYVTSQEQLDNLYYVGAKNGQTERIFSRVRDGSPADGGIWSNIPISTAVTSNNNNRPFVTANSIVLPKRTLIPIETLISVFDADGNTPKAYRFLDTSKPDNSAFLSTNGIRRPSNTWIRVDADDLDTVGITSADIFRTDQIRVQVFDGRFWSPIQTIRVTADVEPSFETDPINPIEDLERTALIDFINQNDGGPVFKSFEVYDASTDHIDPDVDAFANLVMNVNDYYAAQEVHSFSRQEFETLFVEGGKWENRQLDQIYVRANNGRFNTRWTRINIRTEPEYLQSHHFFNQGQPDHWRNYLFGDKIVLTYSFADSFPADGRATGSAAANEFFVFNEVGRAAIRDEFSRWNRMQDTIVFKEVTDTGPVDPQFGPHGFIRIHGYVDPMDTACAFAFIPTNPTYGINDGSTGDIWLNYGLCFTDSAAAWAKDGQQRLIFRHELGHALGLKHPYFVDGNPGNTNTAILPPNLGSHDYSIMYTPGQRPDGLFTRTFGLYGDAAIQDFYGIGTINSGDTRYDIENYWEGDTSFVDGISDRDGNDTLAITNSFFDNILDIREGSFSSIEGIANNLYINHGTVIENVTGGLGDDTIIGNAVDNVLFGTFGDDNIRGNAGNDILIGGQRHDTFFWGIGDGDDIIDERRFAGRDTLVVEEFAAFGFDDFTEDLSFRRLGRDLIVEFKPDGQLISEGSVRIRNQQWGAYRVETLNVFGTRVDLQDLFNKTAAVDQKFVINFTQQTANGFLVSPV